jgi:putative thioredoxin
MFSNQSPLGGGPLGGGPLGGGPLGGGPLGGKKHVYEGTEQNFQQRVMERSMEVPVVVDFWAEWCGPCRTLGPALEKLAEEYDGAFELVKVDVDKNPRLAQAFRVQSIPLVYAFAGGQPVDGFQGALPAAEVKKFIERLVPAPERNPLEIAQEALDAGDYPLAQEAFEAVLQTRPESAGVAHIGLARVALAAQDTARATAHLNQIGEGDPQYTQAQRLKGVLAFNVDAGDETALRAATTANPKDAESWYRLGATLATQLRYEDALDCFLKVVGQDRAYRDDAGRRAMLSLFDLLGAENEISIKYRRRLAALLF